jgi:hypothetical protein
MIEWPNNHINIKSGSCIYDKNSSLSNNKFYLMYQFKSVRESTIENVESMRLRSEYKNRMCINPKISSSSNLKYTNTTDKLNSTQQNYNQNQNSLNISRSNSRMSSRYNINANRDKLLQLNYQD